MWPDRVSNSGPMSYESDALPTALRGLATFGSISCSNIMAHLDEYKLLSDRQHRKKHSCESQLITVIKLKSWIMAGRLTLSFWALKQLSTHPRMNYKK